MFICINIDLPFPLGSLWAMGKVGVGKLGIQENERRHVNLLLGLGEINIQGKYVKYKVSLYDRSK